MRESVWTLFGLLLGIGAGRRARNVVVNISFAGSGWRQGTLHRSPLWVPTAALAGALAAQAMASTFSGEVATFAFVVFCTTLVQQALVDIDTHALPRGRSRGATFTGLVLLGCASLVQLDPVRWWWGLLGSFLSWMFFRILQVLSRGDLGGGDVSFAVLIGLHLGWVAIGNVPIFVLVTFVTGGCAGIVVLLAGRGRRHHIAFGPWMALAAVVTVTWEPQLRSLLRG